MVLLDLLRGDDCQFRFTEFVHNALEQKTISLLKKVFQAKLIPEKLTPLWYQKGILPIAEGNEYEIAQSELDGFAEDFNSLGIEITVRLGAVSTRLDIAEMLVVTNTLAFHRAALRGGAWSSVGKQVEKSLLLTLCGIYEVPAVNYRLTGVSDEGREVDFFLSDPAGQSYRCEVKLMGQGNPESADAFYSRDSQVFIADKLSDLNKRQLVANGVQWVELRGAVGIAKFGEVLTTLQIPRVQSPDLSEQRVGEILTRVLDRI